jgi:chlorite dismutase
MPEHAADGEFGECNYAFQLIQYNGKLALDERKDTIIHEMVHCIDHALQTEMSERQVHAISSGIYSVLKDNPDFFRWVIADQPEVLDDV